MPFTNPLTGPRKSVILLAVIVFGCTSWESIEHAGAERGTAQSFDADYATVKAAALASVHSLNVTIKKTKETNDAYHIVFDKPMSFWSMGEAGRVIVNKQGEKATTVIVYSRKMLPTQILSTGEKEFATAIFNGIDEALGYLE